MTSEHAERFVKKCVLKREEHFAPGGIARVFEAFRACSGERRCLARTPFEQHIWPVPLLIPFVVIVLLALLFVAISRGNELFLISIRDGRLLLVRGRLPIALQDDIEDVLKRARVQSGTIRAVRSSGHSRLITRGIDEPTSQRLRNTFGVHPIQRLQNAPLASGRNLGQLLGITTLAWFLSSRR